MAWACCSIRDAASVRAHRELRWHIQVQCERDQLHDAVASLRAARVPVVIDHCGRPDALLTPSQPGFRALLELGREGHFVKLSGPFRFFNASSRAPSPSRSSRPARNVHAGRCLWGSDWPFLRLPLRMDYGPVLANLTRWLPDEGDRRQVLWDTSARLFGFA
jgi:predicted TIM-barrel fold metal-dependent hydrolase